MIGEILSTGEEIRCGTVVDTNTAHIARLLEGCGVRVGRHLCVGDGLGEIRRAVEEMAARADVAVVTGGLGPTEDDRSAEAAAAAAGVDCPPDPAALAAIEAFFRRRQMPMSRSNRKQARFPRGASWLDNPVGTAPGFCLTLGRCRFYFLPGVPREMRAMMDAAVLPDLASHLGADREADRSRTLVTFGLTESATGERLDGFAADFPDLILGFQVRFPEILVRIQGRDASTDRLESRIASAAEWIAERLGHRLVSDNDASLAAVVGDFLRTREQTLALAESCTGGLMAHWITEVPGSSDYFLFSGVVYHNAAKTAVLGVPEAVLAGHGAVSEATARAMAEGARRAAGAHWGLSTTGIAGPGGGSAEKPVGAVCIGLAGPGGVEAFRHRFPFGDRDMNKRMFAAAALDKLRRALMA